MIDLLLMICTMNCFLKDLVIQEANLNRTILYNVFNGSAQIFTSHSAIAAPKLERSNSKNIKVFILAGQSNMVGSLSNMAELPSEMKGTQTHTLWYDRQNRWVNLQPPTEPLPSTGRMIHQVGFGPEISVGLSISTVLQEKVALVKYSDNGTNLEIDWNPNNPNSLYHKLIELIYSAIGDLYKLGYTPEIAGIFWMQGESDSKSDFYMANNYAVNLINLIQHLRYDLSHPTLPFIYGLIPLTNTDKTSFGNFIYADRVKEHQQLVARSLSYTQTVPTSSLSKSEDNLHFDSQGYINLGKNFAKEWLVMNAYIHNSCDRTTYQWIKPNRFPILLMSSFSVYGRQCFIDIQSIS
jgi:hypothetical protein